MNDFTRLMNLAGARLGARAVAANDEFFAEKENLLKAEKPVFIEGRYTERGKWMDGWETRRRRTPGHDWCMIKLAVPGVVRGVNVQTSFFKGNFPESCSIDGCALDGETDAAALQGAAWRGLLTRSPLTGDADNLFRVDTADRVTHLRLNIYPDGGVARLHAYGEARPDWRGLEASGEPIDLAAAEHGGLVIACNDMFFGDRHNLIMPGRAENMGDGWETRRKRGPDVYTTAHDWAIVRLGRRGSIARVEVDTNHFKGNYPDRCELESCDAAGAGDDRVQAGGVVWKRLLGQTKLQGHARHVFEGELADAGPATHVRLKIFPDGGVSRLRLWGRPVAGVVAEGGPP